MQFAMRDIFWKLREAGGGPDHLFVARFEPGDAERLSHLVRELPLPGFKINDIVLDVPQHGAAAVSLIDEHTHANLLAQRGSGERANIYIFTSVEVKENALFVHAAYGGHADATPLAVALARSAEVTLQGWEVRSHGYGPPGDRIYAQGSGSQELLKYLQGELAAA